MQMNPAMAAPAFQPASPARPADHAAAKAPASFAPLEFTSVPAEKPAMRAAPARPGTHIDIKV